MYTDNYYRRVLREVGYNDDMLKNMTDEDCEAEVSHLAD